MPYEKNPDTGEMEPIHRNPISGEVVGTVSGLVYRVEKTPVEYLPVAGEREHWALGTERVERQAWPEGVDVVSAPEVVERIRLDHLTYFIYEQKVGFILPRESPKPPTKSPLETEAAFMERVKKFDEAMKEYRRKLAVYEDKHGSYVGRVWHIRSGPALSRSVMNIFLTYAYTLAKRDPEAAVKFLLKVEPGLTTRHLEDMLEIPHTTIWRIINGGYITIERPMKTELETEEEYKGRLAEWEAEAIRLGQLNTQIKKRVGGLLDQDIWIVGSWRGYKIFSPKTLLTHEQTEAEMKRIAPLMRWKPTAKELEAWKKAEVMNRENRRKQMMDFWV